MRLNLQPLNDPKWYAILPVGASVVGFVAGAVAGHLYEKKQNKAPAEVFVVDVAALKRDLDLAVAEYETDEEIEEETMPPTEADIARHPAAGSPLDRAMEVDLEEEEGSMVDWKETFQTEEPESDLVEVRNIFERQKEQGWDWDEELKSRTDKAPYIIHEEEFAAHEEPTYEQSTLTWYAGDEIMADSKDTPLYMWKEVTGDNLRFGHGSSDPHSVYIRNPQLKGEYEILIDEGSFEEVVLGLSAEEEIEADELKHSRYLRFRPED